VEEELLMKRGDKWLDVTNSLKNDASPKDTGQQDRPEVNSLADLAGRLVLPVLVGVCDNLSEKDKKQYSQTGSEYSRAAPHDFSVNGHRSYRFLRPQCSRILS
jgi:hypothetical protein